jgi:demethylmenaquinone methyltransferase/2-methoxy-6-polyprenyl-1,4-benzoquinol methylase
MFDTVAKRYDLTNDLMTAGIQRTWRRSMVAAVAPRRGDLVLDLAAGTGCSSEPFSAHGATAVPCDFSVGMLQQGKKDRPGLPFVAGDGTRLPFLDDTFDAVTISYGLRNFVDPISGLKEMLRVTRPGGRLVVCEFSRAAHGLSRRLHAGAAQDRLGDRQRGRRLRLPRRVDPRLAGPARAGRDDRRGGLAPA